MLKLFTILFKSHVLALFHIFKNVLGHTFVNTVGPLFNFMLRQELRTTETIFSKMFADSARVVVSNHQQLPQILKSSRRFPLTLPIRTNLLVTSLM